MQAACLTLCFSHPGKLLSHSTGLNELLGVPQHLHSFFKVLLWETGSHCWPVPSRLGFNHKGLHKHWTIQRRTSGWLLCPAHAGEHNGCIYPACQVNPPNPLSHTWSLLWRWGQVRPDTGDLPVCNNWAVAEGRKRLLPNPDTNYQLVVTLPGRKNLLFCCGKTRVSSHKLNKNNLPTF